jgi:hypothetical protein
MVRKLHFPEYVYPIPSLAYLLSTSCWAVTVTPTRVADIIQRSVANLDADWSVAPQFIFIERAVITKSGTRTTKTWQVSMKRFAEPLSPAVAGEQ